MINKRLFILTRVLLKNGGGVQEKKNKNKKRWKINKGLLMYILVGLAFLPLAVNIIFMAEAIYDSLAQIQQQGIVLSLGIGIVSFIMFFFGIFYVMNVFYFANDIERLLPLPLKPSEIMAAKFFTVVIYEYLTEAVVMLPVLGVYGVKSGAGMPYYLLGFLIFILIPVIPLSFASIIIMLIMRFTNIGRNKDRFKLIGGIAAVFISIGINAAIQRATMQSVDPKALQNMLIQGGNSLVGLAGRMFPGTSFAAVGLVNSSNIQGLSNVLVFVAITVIVFFLFMYLGELLYFKGVIGLSEAGGSRKIGIEELKRKSVRTSKLNSYIAKELRILFRTPIYFINCVLMNFLWPVFFIIMPLSQSGQSGGPEDMNMEMLKSLVQNDEYAGIILAISFAVILFIAGSNGVTSTTISREGQQLYISKYLPLSYVTQIKAKVLSGVAISAIGMLVMILIMGAVLGLPLLIIVLSLLSGFAAIFLVSFTGIIIDLINPKLNWDNEQKAVKQNLNVLFNMLISIGLAVAIVFVSIKFKQYMDVYATFAFLVLIFGLIDVVLYKFLNTKGVKLFARIEG